MQIFFIKLSRRQKNIKDLQLVIKDIKLFTLLNSYKDVQEVMLSTLFYYEVKEQIEELFIDPMLK